MNFLLLAAGIVIVVFTTIDVFWTTLWIRGHAGPLAGRVATFTNRALMRLLSPFGHDALSAKGPLVLVTDVFVWVTLLWLGWVLAFSSVDGAVVQSQTGAPADLPDRIYFVGYAMFTMGNGDFVPVGGGWQFATALTALSGLILLTLLLTYLVSVVSAVVALRSFATQVHGLGLSPEEFVCSMWDGEGFRGADLILVSLVEQLSMLTERHLAYPMLHYYHPAESRQAASHAAAVLNEAVALLAFGVVPARRPAPAVLRLAEAAIGGFLGTLKSAHVAPSSRVPPPPRLHPLREAGIPVVSDPELDAVLDGRSMRRRLLLGLIESECRRWPGSAQQERGARETQPG